MRILRIHNYYQQAGGEDQSFEAEINLLKAHGHEVICFTKHNNEINQMSSLSIAQKTIWNQEVYTILTQLIKQEQPDVVHFENTFPLVSPAAYYAAKRLGVPVVQSLRNYRLFCANAYFLRDGHVCEACLGRSIPWPALYYKCYRNSLQATGIVFLLQTFHRLIKTWQRTIDRYIALTDFARRKYIEAGLPEHKIVVKPNFLVTDPGIGEGNGHFALFVGRLSKEKGVETLLDAWRSSRIPLPLWIVGDGPLREIVRTASLQNPNIVMLGQQSTREVLTLMKQAKMLIFPSLWFEGLPRVIVEAYAVGLPVLASNIGSMSSLICHEKTGLHFRPGDQEDIIQKVLYLLQNSTLITTIRHNARRYYEENFTSERNYQQLLQIYQSVCQTRSKS